MKRDAYELIKATQRLPSPKGVVMEILRLIEDASTTVELLGTVIESDPALSATILKIVNSPMAGMPRKVASISRATVLLGFRTVASLTLGVSLVSDNKKGRCSKFDYDKFWSHSLACAVSSRHLAQYLKFSSDEAFTCGLLSQIGRLAFASAYPDRYAQALSVVGQGASDLSDFELEMFGINHNVLAAEMMVDWHLPRLFNEAVRAQEDPDASGLQPDSQAHTFARMLHLSGAISEVLMASTVDAELLSSITNKAFKMGIRPDQVQESFDAIRDQWRDAGRVFSIQTRHVPTLAEIHSRCTRRRSDIAEAG